MELSLRSCLKALNVTVWHSLPLVGSSAEIPLGECLVSTALDLIADAMLTCGLLRHVASEPMMPDSESGQLVVLENLTHFLLAVTVMPCSLLRVSCHPTVASNCFWPRSNSSPDPAAVLLVLNQSLSPGIAI